MMRPVLLALLLLAGCWTDRYWIAGRTVACLRCCDAAGVCQITCSVT
jgi:hypothetical protein